MRIACQDQQHIGDDFLRIVQVILVLSAEGEMRLCVATIKYAFHDMMTDLMPEGGRHSDWMIRRIHIYERFTDQNTITHVKTSQSATLGIVERLGLQYGTQFRRNFRQPTKIQSPKYLLVKPWQRCTHLGENLRHLAPV